ncbi:uncharacterized protein LOC134258840 [Saccostrea cucullata]|uniref:uncharacterized protein LOC134258840 n=1 Tax=Saccostrea cuccullata TaxID=36930 RepID=UPI002ED0B2D5
MLVHGHFSTNKQFYDGSWRDFIFNQPKENTADFTDGQEINFIKIFIAISDYNKWSRCKALFFFKAKERAAKEVLQIDDEGESSDDEYEEIHFPHRSTTFATNLQSLCLEYCDSITDTDMEDIVTVCRGSISVIDYYSCEVRPKVLTLRKFEVKDLSGAKND